MGEPLNINEAALLLIEEIDRAPFADNFKTSFVYNYFKKNERVFIFKDEYNQNLNGQNLLTVPRYVTIDFQRHDESNYDAIDANNPLWEKIKNKNVTIRDFAKSAKSEDKISPEEYFNVRFQDKQTTAGFYDSMNSEVVNTYYDISTNEEIKNKIAAAAGSFSWGNEEAFANSWIQDTDFYQPWAFAFYFGFASLAHSGTLNKLNNLRFNTRVNTKYASKIINKIAADGSSPFSDEMKELKEAWGYIDKRPIIDTTESYFEFQQMPESYIAEPKISVLGYVIEKYENKMTINMTKNRNELIKHPPIYVSLSDRGTIIDRNVRYGGSYQYTIKTVCGVTMLKSINVGGNLIPNALLLKTFISGGSSKREIYCSERIAPDPPVNPFFQYNFKEDALLIQWDFPFNKQQDIKRFQVYRRKTLDVPFALICEYDFDDSEETDGFSPASGNEDNISKLKSPKCYHYDSDFNEESSYIYAIASIDARGLTSGYSDQFLVRYDRFINKTYATFISREGAPKPYPNIFLDYDALPDVIKEEKVKKIKIYFNPECKEITTIEPNPDPDQWWSPIDEQETLIMDGEPGSKGEYSIQIINVDTQEQKIVKLDIMKEEFTTREEQLAQENRSYTSGI